MVLRKRSISLTPRVLVKAATAALVRVQIDEAVRAGGFRRVTTWRPGP